MHPTTLRLVVLPFLDLSGELDGGPFADTLTELLISRLAARPLLRVVSRTSAMHYKHSRRRLPEIARELDVSRVVEGSVLRSERSIQVVVRLVDPATELLELSRIYVWDAGNAAGLESKIVEGIAIDIESALHPEAGR
ncbi:MAG: hypothetical protein U1F54_09635 [Burkholderiales bacterium]